MVIPCKGGIPVDTGPWEERCFDKLALDIQGSSCDLPPPFDAEIRPWLGLGAYRKQTLHYTSSAASDPESGAAQSWGPYGFEVLRLGPFPRDPSM